MSATTAYLSDPDGVEVSIVAIDDGFWASSESAMKATLAARLPGYLLDLVVDPADPPERVIASMGEFDNWLATLA